MASKINNMLYYCVNENNDCPKRNECQRFLHSEYQDKTTLFKTSCTKHNNYILFLKETNDDESGS